MKTHVIFCLCTFLGALTLPDITAAGFLFEATDFRDLSDANLKDLECKTVYGTCTLRAAIEQINGSGCDHPYSRIILSPGTYFLTQGPALQFSGKGTFTCFEIQGTGPLGTVIDGNAPTGESSDLRGDSIFHVTNGASVQLDGIIITHGHSHSPGGGAIWNEGSLLILNSLLTENSTHGWGGAIYNRGTLGIGQSTLSNNWAMPNRDRDFDGDGILDKVAGGAIANNGEPNIGINSYSASVYMQNVTISGNLGGLDPHGNYNWEGNGGGGILNVAEGTIQMNHTTIAYNITYGGENGGGVYSDKLSYVEFWNTIVAKNTSTSIKNPESPNDCKGTLKSFGNNLVGYRPDDCTVTVQSAPGDQIGNSIYFNLTTGRLERLPPIDPMLDALSQNGGYTPTHALREGSPAIDAGNPSDCAEYDQRYLPRPKDGPAPGGYDGVATCDIGAYEHQGQ